MAVYAVGVALQASAQNFPFPQHVSYAAGIQPNNVSQSSMDNTVSNYWNTYKSRYIKSAGGSPTRYYIAYNIEGQGDSGAATVSEAHGYGMVLCAYMGDKTHFDGMYRFYKDHPSQNNSWLMAWQQSTNGFVDMGGADSATDGDMDIAYSLLLADKQWGSGGSINYFHEATNMINAIMQSDVNQSRWTLRLGDWATTGTSHGYAYSTSTRPSDFMFDHMRSYYDATGDGRWTNVINQTYNVVNAIYNNYSSGTGLTCDFVVYNGSAYLPAPADFLEGATDGEYAYNSCRTPWRYATEYVLRGTTGILSEMRKMNSWIQTKSGGNASHIYPGYTLGGTALDTSYTDDSFTTPFAVCAMIDSGNQTWMNTLWTWVAARGINSNDGYFGNSITMQSIIMISGNWWAPVYAAPDFTIGATPPSQTVTAGSGTSYTVNLTSLNGFNSSASLSVSGLPTGVTGTFSPTAVTPTGSSTLSISTSASTTPGTYTLTISATGGGVNHTTSVTLTVNAVGGSLPAGWTDVDIGSVGVAGNASYASPTFTLNGSGNDIWSTADAFNYAYQSTSGDLAIAARVATQENTAAWAKAGVMIRESTAANAAYVGVYITPSNGVSMQVRTATGVASVDLARQAGFVAPYWVKIVRSGSTFSGYSSADGTTWTLVGSTNLTMATAATAGLAVCAHDNTQLNTSTFDSVTMATYAFFEAEALTVVTNTQTFTIINDTNCSGGQFIQLNATNVNDLIKFLVPGINAGTYDLRVGVKDNYNRATVQTYTGKVGGAFNAFGAVFDEYTATATYPEIDLGPWTVSTSDKYVGFSVTGHNASSSSYVIAVDYIELVPQ